MLLHSGLACSALVLLMVFNLSIPANAAGFRILVMSGLSAAIWVLLLTGFSRLLFRTLSQRSEIKMFRALKNTPVDSVYRGGEA